MSRGVHPSLSHPSLPLSFVLRMVPPPLPWLPPALRATTFPFSECLLSHFLPRAQSSVNIFECINLALLHKGNLPVCHSSAQLWLPEFPVWKACLGPASLSSPCLPPLGEVQGAVVRNGDEGSLGNSRELCRSELRMVELELCVPVT